MKNKTRKRLSRKVSFGLFWAVLSFGTLGLLTLIVWYVTINKIGFDTRSYASSPRTKPYIVSAEINLEQTIDTNQNNKINLRLVERLDTNPTDTMNITITDIVLSDSRLRDKNYNLFVFATCKTNGNGINWWGYPTRTWIMTGIPVSQDSIVVNFTQQIESRLLDPSYPADIRAYFSDMANSGAKCNVELGLKDTKYGSAAMNNYAWFPYVNQNYYSTHPLLNHPYSFEILPENSF